MGWKPWVLKSIITLAWLIYIFVLYSWIGSSSWATAALYLGFALAGGTVPFLVREGPKGPTL